MQFKNHLTFIDVFLLICLKISKQLYHQQQTH